MARRRTGGPSSRSTTKKQSSSRSRVSCCLWVTSRTSKRIFSVSLSERGGWLLSIGPILPSMRSAGGRFGWIWISDALRAMAVAAKKRRFIRAWRKSGNLFLRSCSVSQIRIRSRECQSPDWHSETGMRSLEALPAAADVSCAAECEKSEDQSVGRWFGDNECSFLDKNFINVRTPRVIGKGFHRDPTDIAPYTVGGLVVVIDGAQRAVHPNRGHSGIDVVRAIGATDVDRILAVVYNNFEAIGCIEVEAFCFISKTEIGRAGCPSL